MNWTSTQQDELVHLIQRRNERSFLQSQLERTQADLQERQQEQALFLDQWQAEQADVDRLNRPSWASVYYDALNRKAEQLSQEEAEAQQARLRYDAVDQSVQALQRHLDSLKQQLSQLASPDAAYETLLKAKRESLVKRTDDAGQRYVNYLTDLTVANRHLQELSEAHRAGLEAMYEVDQLRSLLDSARSWGTWDIWGGSAFSSAIKYQKLDEVRDQSYRVTQRMSAFRSEYRDLNREMPLDWHFASNTTRFVDIFFDNIFTDMAVQDRINQALSEAQQLANQLASMVDDLKNQLEQETRKMTTLSAEIQQFLETV